MNFYSSFQTLAVERVAWEGSLIDILEWLGEILKRNIIDTLEVVNLLHSWDLWIIMSIYTFYLSPRLTAFSFSFSFPSPVCKDRRREKALQLTPLHFVFSLAYLHSIVEIIRGPRLTNCSIHRRLYQLIPQDQIARMRHPRKRSNNDPTRPPSQIQKYQN